MTKYNYSSSSSSDDSEIIELRERKSEKKSKKNDKRKHRRDNYSSDPDHEGDDRRKSKKSEKRKHIREKRGKKRRKHEIEGMNSDIDNESTESKNHKKKKDKRRKKSRKFEEHESEDPFEVKYGNFLPKLFDLLSNNGDLATELPYLLIKLCSGSSINLSQIPDISVSLKLKQLFTILGCTELSRNNFLFDDNGCWKTSSQAVDDERALVLVKLVRFLLNKNNLTMDVIADFEREKKSALRVAEAAKVAKSAPDSEEESNENKTPSLVSMLLDTFQSKQQKQSSSLAQELCSIMQMIHDGEIICLDGLEDKFLKKAIEQLFTIMGLEKEEMADSDDDDSDCIKKNEDRLISYGYTLPSSEGEVIATVKAKLHDAIKASKIYHDKKTKQKIGPALPKHMTQFKSEPAPESDESNDEGPAPLGSQKAKVRTMNRQITPTHNQQQMQNNGGREEWMMTPGEHNFLKGVMSSGAMKSRKFKNEKNNNPTPAPKPMNPQIKQQVDSIMDAHRAARGPSLVEQHRIHKAEEKAAKEAAGPKGKNGESWNWSREKDLDSGRRVDKKYLNMVMGGASTDLKSKFQGSYSAGFT